MKLVFHEAALSDLRDIHQHIAQNDPRIAVSVIYRIRMSLERLTMFPRSGRTGTVSGTRELVVPGLPFIVVYEIKQSQVEIVAVFHTAVDH